MVEERGAKYRPLDVIIGRRLRQRREKLNLSQQKVGDAVEVSFQQIQKYESGRNRIAASTLYQISELLDVPFTYFFEEKEGRE